MKKFTFLLFLFFAHHLFAEYINHYNTANYSTYFRKFIRFYIEDFPRKEDNNYKSHISFYFPQFETFDFGFEITERNQTKSHYFGTGVFISKRFNSSILTGLKFSSFYQKNSVDNLSVNPGIILKPFSNWHIGLSGKTERFDNVMKHEYYIENEFFFNKSISISHQISREISQQRMKLRFGKLSLSIGNSFIFEQADNLTFQIGFTIHSDDIIFSGEGFFADKDKSINSGITSFYGKYYLPRQIKNISIPIVKNYNNYHGLVIQNEVRIPEVNEIEIEVKKGDNLFSISRNLPDNADSFFHDNVQAIVDYNNIENPEKIFIGQKILIPSEKRITSIQLSSEDKELLAKLADKTITSKIKEVHMNRAFVLWKTENFQKYKRHLPQKGSVNNPYLLNSQAIYHIIDKDYSQAITKLEKVLKINPDDKIVRINLAFAQLMNGNKKVAKELLLQLKNDNYQSELWDELAKQVNISE